MKKIRIGWWLKWLERTAMLSFGIWMITIGFLRWDKGFDIVMFNDYYMGMSEAWFFITGGKFVVIGAIVLLVLWVSEKIS